MTVYPVNMYLMHYFALAEHYDKNGTPVEGWAEHFSFPPALLKLVVRHQSRTINVSVQQCLAINDKGISVYGPNKGLRRRLIYHVLYHERPLLATFDSKLNSLTREPLGCPHTTWFWARPHGVSPRQTGCWVSQGCHLMSHLLLLDPKVRSMHTLLRQPTDKWRGSTIEWIQPCFTECRL